MSTFLFLFCLSLNGNAVELKTPMDPTAIAGAYGVNLDFQSKETALQNWKPELLNKKRFFILEGTANVQIYQEGKDLYAVSHSQVVYVKSSLQDLELAVDPLAAPYPPPIFEPGNISEKTVNEFHRFTLFNFLYQQKVKIFSIKANCHASTHYMKTSDSTDLRVQTLVDDCYDPENSQKLIFRDGIQSTDLISITPEVTAILLRNFVIAKKNKMGLFKPSPEDLMHASQDMAHTSLKAVLAKLGMNAEFKILFHPSM